MYITSAQYLRVTYGNFRGNSDIMAATKFHLIRVLDISETFLG